MASKKTLKIRVKERKKSKGQNYRNYRRSLVFPYSGVINIFMFKPLMMLRRATLATASTLCKDLAEKIKGKKKVDVAKEVGKLIAERLQSLGVDKVVFDRGRFLYHGRVKALADAARENGLKF